MQFVPDVTPFEFMKIRILNGGHAAIAYPAGLLDVHFVHDAMNHPLVGAFFGKTETGKDITAGDPIWPRLTALAAKAKSGPLVWLSMDDVYGDVGKSEIFRKAFTRSLNDIWSKGAAKALADFVG